MKIAALYFSLAIALIVVLRVRAGAKRQRTTTMTRLSEEVAAVGVVSPTEELFRSEGVPIPDALRSGLATAPAPVTETKLTTALQSAVGAVRGIRGDTLAPAVPAPVVSPPPAGASTSLAAVVEGIAMPCDLAPVTTASGPSASSASFVTAGYDTAALSAALSSELARIGGTVTWIDGTTATVRRGESSAVISIYEHPDDVHETDGRPTYPTASIGQVVVKLTAV